VCSFGSPPLRVIVHLDVDTIVANRHPNPSGNILALAFFPIGGTIDMQSSTLAVNLRNDRRGPQQNERYAQ